MPITSLTELASFLASAYGAGWTYATREVEAEVKRADGYGLAIALLNTRHGIAFVVGGLWPIDQLGRSYEPDIRPILTVLASLTPAQIDAQLQSTFFPQYEPLFLVQKALVNQNDGTLINYDSFLRNVSVRAGATLTPEDTGIYGLSLNRAGTVLNTRTVIRGDQAQISFQSLPFHEYEILINEFLNVR